MQLAATGLKFAHSIVRLIIALFSTVVCCTFRVHETDRTGPSRNVLSLSVQLAILSGIVFSGFACDRSLTINLATQTSEMNAEHRHTTSGHPSCCQ